MKMGVYQDYMRLLFDKYLSPIFYIVVFVLAVPQFNYLYNKKASVDEVLEILGVIAIVILVFYTVRLLTVYFPSLIQKLLKTAKKDMQAIREEHNTDESS